MTKLIQESPNGHGEVLAGPTFEKVTSLSPVSGPPLSGGCDWSAF